MADKLATYPVRSHRCGRQSASIADIVITNCEKSAEAIVGNLEGLNNVTV